MWLEPLHSLHVVQHAALASDVSCRSPQGAQTTLPMLFLFSLHLCSDLCDIAFASLHIYFRPLSRFLPTLSLFRLISVFFYIRIFTEPWFAGNTYSIKNVGSGTSRVFFSQAFEKTAEAEE